MSLPDATQEKRIGILGGTFNPIHISHVILAEEAYRQLNLDCVYFMPARKPPHKDGHGIISDEHRLELVRRMIADRDYFKISTIEFEREGLSYTSDTLQIINERHPDWRIYFIIGGDSLDAFENWHEPGQILKRAALVCTGRADFDNSKALDKINYLRRKFSSGSFIPEIISLNAPLMDISSTMLRTGIECGFDMSSYLNRDSWDYICTNGLYLDPCFERIKGVLERRLKPSRYAHTLRVAEYCFRLAKAYGADEYRAYLAGLLHDCAKHFNDAECLKEAARMGIEPLACEKATPSNLLHSKIGAELVKEEFGIEDEEIRSAVYYHTTGHNDMSLLEKIVFSADYLEYGRSMRTSPSLNVIRSVSFSDLDLAVYYILENTVNYLRSNFKDNICETTIECYEFYKAVINNRPKE